MVCDITVKDYLEELAFPFYEYIRDNPKLQEVSDILSKKAELEMKYREHIGHAVAAKALFRLEGKKYLLLNLGIFHEGNFTSLELTATELETQSECEVKSRMRG